MSTDEKVVIIQPEEMSRVEKQRRFIEMRAQGYSLAAVARDLDMARSTMGNWEHELEAEIAAARAIELEELQAEYYLLKEGRIRLLGDYLNKMKAELEQRELSEIPTDKLMELFLKFYDELKAEYVPIKPLAEQQISLLKQLQNGRK